MFTPQMLKLLGTGIWESLYMTLVATFLAYLFGLPLGLVLSVTDKEGIRPVRPLNAVLGFLVNLLRSVPFIILLVAIIPFTRKIVGTSIGSTATIVPLVVSAIPFVARMVESSLKEVDAGVIEAAPGDGYPDLSDCDEGARAGGNAFAAHGRGHRSDDHPWVFGDGGLCWRRRPGARLPSTMGITAIRRMSCWSRWRCWSSSCRSFRRSACASRTRWINA